MDEPLTAVTLYEEGHLVNGSCTRDKLYNNIAYVIKVRCINVMAVALGCNRHTKLQEPKRLLAMFCMCDWFECAYKQSRLAEGLQFAYANREKILLNTNT
jgi:hypothetical protein